MLSCLGRKTVKNLLLACQEVLGFLFRDDPVTDGAADEEVTVSVILLEEVLTGIALTCHLDTSSTDGTSAIEVTGWKSKLYLSFLDDEPTREGLSVFVAHLDVSCLTCLDQCLHIGLGDGGSMVLSEHDELTVVPSAVGVFFELSQAHPKGCSVMWPCPQMGQMPIDCVFSILVMIKVCFYVLFQKVIPVSDDALGYPLSLHKVGPRLGIESSPEVIP